MNREWIKPGGRAVVFYAGSSAWKTPGSVKWVQIQRLTQTQIVLVGGRRFRKEDLREVGVDFYRSGSLIPPDDPRIAEAAEQTRLNKSRTDALTAVDEWRKGAGGPAEKARAAAVALLLYADAIDPPE